MKKGDKFYAYQKKDIAGISIPVSIKDEPARHNPFTLVGREFQENKQHNMTLRKYHAIDKVGDEWTFNVETWRVEMVKELPLELKEVIA